MSIIKFKPKSNLQLSAHFNSDEFDCPCGRCTENYIDTTLIDSLEKVRVEYNSPLRVTSGFRCAQHNAEVGGVTNSAHGSGLAADIQPALVNVDELDKVYEISFKHFNNIGDGRRLHFVHVDVRQLKPDGKKRTWSY